MHNMHSHSHPFPVSKPRPIHALNPNLNSLMYWLHSWFVPSSNLWNTNFCTAQTIDYSKTSDCGLAPKSDGNDHFSIAFRAVSCTIAI